jgi:hypothetical protein
VWAPRVLQSPGAPRYIGQGDRRRLRRALDLYLDIAALKFELGNAFFDDEVDEFFQFFLIHLVRRVPLSNSRFLESGRQSYPALVLLTQPR